MHPTPAGVVPDRLLPFLLPPGDGRHRLFHGRGGTTPELEWLTVDLYPPVLVATLFRDPGEPARRHLAGLLGERLPELACDCLVLQHRYGARVRNEVLAGAMPSAPEATEGGLRFLLDFARGQNPGFFPDMRPGRDWVRGRSLGRNVLNLFAFTCSFSVAALAGGARQVVNIDLSRPALELGRRNHELNGLDPRRTHLLAHDIFRSWKKLHRLGRYELVIIDPPSEQKGSFVARRDYARVVRQLHRLLAPEADILACLNAPWLGESFLDEVVTANLEGAQRGERLPFAPGFAEADREAGLKAVHYRYRRPDRLPPPGIKAGSAGQSQPLSRNASGMSGSGTPRAGEESR